MEVPRFEQNAPNPNVIQIQDTSSSFEEAQDEHEDENAIVVASESNSVDIEINQNQRLIPGAANEENLPRKADRSGRGFCTIPVAVFLGCTNVFMILMVFLLPIACNRKGETPAQACFLEPFSWLLYTHTFYWFCHLLGDQYLKVISSLRLLMDMPKKPSKAKRPFKYRTSHQLATKNVQNILTNYKMM